MDPAYVWGHDKMKIHEVMTNRVASIREESDVYRAAEVVALSGVSDLMVLDEHGQFVGVLSEGDILRAALPKIDDILGEGGSLAQAFSLFLDRGRELSGLPIKPMIIREPIVLGPDDHVAQAAVTLVQQNIRLLPVVQRGRLLGVVTRADICEAVVGQIKRPALNPAGGDDG